jgi:hypothetical protein
MLIAFSLIVFRERSPNLQPKTHNLKELFTDDIGLGRTMAHMSLTPSTFTKLPFALFKHVLDIDKYSATLYA